MTALAAPVGRKGDGPLFAAPAEGLAGAFGGALTALPGAAFAGNSFAADTFAADLGIALTGVALEGAALAACFAGAAFAGGFFPAGIFLVVPVLAGRVVAFADFGDFIAGRDLAAVFLATGFAFAGFLTPLRDFAAGFARFFAGALVGVGRFFFATGCFFFFREGCFFCAMVIAGL